MGLEKFVQFLNVLFIAMYSVIKIMRPALKNVTLWCMHLSEYWRPPFTIRNHIFPQDPSYRKIYHVIPSDVPTTWEVWSDNIRRSWLSWNKLTLAVFALSSPGGGFHKWPFIADFISMISCTGWEFAGCKNHVINGQAKSWPLCYFTLHNSECLVECECSYLLMVPPGKNKHELSGLRHVWQWSCGVPRYWAGLGLQKSFCIPLISMGRVNVHVHVCYDVCMYIIACGVHAYTCVVV